LRVRFRGLIRPWQNLNQETEGLKSLTKVNGIGSFDDSEEYLCFAQHRDSDAGRRARMIKSGSCRAAAVFEDIGGGVGVEQVQSRSP
jgi:hypothetical protein